MPVSFKSTLNIKRCGWVISLIACPLQWPSTPFKYCFLDGQSESPEDAAVQLLNSLLFIRECSRTCRSPGVVFYLGWSDPWGHTANLLFGSYKVHRSGWYCKGERSWEFANCLFSVWLGKRVCLLQLPPYFQSKTVVMCVGVTSLAGRFIQKIGQKQILWEYKGRLISPLHPAIHYVVQFKLVTSPCNLLIFPCQEALAALYLQQGD